MKVGLVLELGLFGLRWVSRVLLELIGETSEVGVVWLVVTYLCALVGVAHLDACFVGR